MHKSPQCYSTADRPVCIRVPSQVFRILRPGPTHQNTTTIVQQEQCSKRSIWSPSPRHSSPTYARESSLGGAARSSRTVPKIFARVVDTNTQLAHCRWSAGQRARPRQKKKKRRHQHARARAATKPPNSVVLLRAHTCRVPEAEWYLAASIPDVYELPPTVRLSTNQKDTSIPLRFPRLSIITYCSCCRIYIHTTESQPCICWRKGGMTGGGNHAPMIARHGVWWRASSTDEPINHRARRHIGTVVRSIGSHSHVTANPRCSTSRLSFHAGCRKASK